MDRITAHMLRPAERIRISNVASRSLLMNKVNPFLFQIIYSFFIYYWYSPATLVTTQSSLKAKRQSPTVTTMSNRLSHPASVTICQCLYSYTGTSPSAMGQIVRVTGQTNVVAVVSAVPTTSSTPTPPKPSGSSSSSNGPNVAA